MCGILGMAFLNGHKIKDSKVPKTILKRLFIESKVRGTDATGVAFADNDHIAVIKHNIHGEKFVNSDFYEKAVERYIGHDGKPLNEINVILGHTRAETKGAHTNRHNNHPVVSNKIIGVHNGHISNDDELFDDYERAFPASFRRKAWVDTEIIFRLIDHYKYIVDEPMYDAVKSTSEKLTGGYACAFVAASEPWMLWLFKDWSPTTVFHYPEHGIVIFASAEAFINKAIVGLELGYPTEIEYDRESCLAINTITNAFTSFELKQKGWKGHQGVL